MDHFAKYAAGTALLVFGVLLLARDGAPAKYTKTLSTLAGVALGVTVSLATGDDLNHAINHAITGGALGGLVAFGAAALRGGAPAIEPAPPTPRNDAPKGGAS